MENIEHAAAVITLSVTFRSSLRTAIGKLATSILIEVFDGFP
jgi:hypothetical protein